MSAHLTREAIERYVARRGKVDEILSAAEHLDVCFDCRDVAAAMVDDGSSEVGHVRHRSSSAQRRAPRAYLPWIIAAVVVIVVAIAVVWLL